MSERDHDRWPDGFEDAVRRQASRPPQVSPRQAALQLRATLQGRGHAPRWRVPVSVAAALAAVLAIVTPPSRPPVPAPEPARQGAAPPPEMPPASDNVVLWWLDAETPVYFVVAPPSQTGGAS